MTAAALERHLAGLACVVIDGRSEPGAPARALVVLLHGLTYPGDQLLPLARAIAAAPEAYGAMIVVPCGPVELSGFAEGRSWWPVSVGEMMRRRGRGLHQDLTAARPAGMTAARQQLMAALAEVDGSAPLLLVGFSQGAMLATDVALHEPRPVRALALLAGTIVDEADWRTALAAPGRVAGLPVLMWHARADEVLRLDTAARLRDALREAGADVRWIEQDGGHAPSPEAEAAACAFVVRVLSRPG